MRDICYETIRKDRYHTKNKNRQNVLELEIWGAFFVHCSILSIVYQYESMVFYNFTPKGGFGKALEIKLRELKYIKHFVSLRSYMLSLKIRAHFHKK